jgi:hypothetical protein
MGGGMTKLDAANGNVGQALVNDYGQLGCLGDFLVRHTGHYLRGAPRP